MYNSTIISCYGTILTVIVALVGDYLLNNTKQEVFKALFDNTTHALIGGLSWFVVCLHYKSKHTLMEILFCTILSSAIDLDHFIVSKSFNIKDALNLQNRPPLHCSTIPVISSIFLFLWGWLNNTKWLQRFALMIFVSFFSHHTRDATRRGYWFCPFGSTPPVPYFLYITITCLTPYIVCLVLYYSKIERYADLLTI